MRSETMQIRTGGTATVHDLTDACAAFVRGEDDGLLNVFVPHATAGLAILETGAGSDDDLLAALDDVLPRDGRWRHRHGSAGHGRDHVLPGVHRAVDQRPGARRPAAARHLAVDLPRRHQRRQRRARRSGSASWPGENARGSDPELRAGRASSTGPSNASAASSAASCGSSTAARG